MLKLKIICRKRKELLFILGVYQKEKEINFKYTTHHWNPITPNLLM